VPARTFSVKQSVKQRKSTYIDQEHVFFFREENVVVLHMNNTSEFQGLYDADAMVFYNLMFKRISYWKVSTISPPVLGYTPLILWSVYVSDINSVNS